MHFQKNDTNDEDSIFNHKPVTIASALDPHFKLAFFPMARKMSVKAKLLVPQSTSSDDIPSATGAYPTKSQSVSDIEDEAGDEWSPVFNSFATAAEWKNETNNHGSDDDEFVVL